MRADPAATPVVKPVDAPMLATLGVPEVNAVLPVTSAVELSENVAVTSNCFVALTCTLGLIGVMAMDCNVADVTVSVVLPVRMPEAPEMTAVPDDTPEAKPALGPLAMIVATDGVSELNVVIAVMSLLLPSLKLPIAINCCWPPIAIDGFAGVTAIESSVAWVTFNIAELTLPPKLAVMVAVPMATPLAMPSVLVTVANATLSDDQVADFVTSIEVPSA